MGVDGLLLFGVLALAGALGATAPIETGLAIAACVGLLSRRAPAWLLAVGLLAAAAGAVRAGVALGSHERGREAMRALLEAPRRCTVTLELDESPVWVHGSARLRGVVRHAECDERLVPAGVRVQLYGGPSDLRRGDVVDVTCDLAPTRLFRNLGAPDPTPYAARGRVWLSGSVHALELLERGTGLGALIDRARAHVRRRIVATFAPGAEELARALVLGETDLSEEDNAAFKKSGLSHLLAVSGTHLVFAVVSLVRALRVLLAHIPLLAARGDVGRVAAGAGVALSLLYADFAGGSGSAWRAAWMLAVVFAASALGRRPSGVRALGASLVVGVLVDPLAAYDLSFLLSVAATVGLMGLGSPVVRRIARLESRALRWLLESVTATVSSMIPCAPLLLLMAPELTLAGVAANVVAAPFGELVSLPLCLGHGLLAWAPALERGVALTASGALLAVRAVAHASANATWLALDFPEPTRLQLCALSVATALWCCGRRRVLVAILACGGLLGLELVERSREPPRGELRLTAVDVGQGDGLIVDFPSGRRWLVDAGGFMGTTVDPGARAVLPLLRARRAARIDVMVISHPHPDHFTGLVAVLRALPVGELWDTGQGEAHGSGPVYRELLALARARGVRIRRPDSVCGEHREGDVRVAVFGPCPLDPDASANDNSFVIKLSYGERALLLTGDAEHDQEAALVAREGDALRADVLKVGHHGSRTSSTREFVARVRPTVALISAGTRNRFGHPHAPTLATLSSHGVRVERTDESGSILVRTDGQALSVETYRSARGYLFD
ncbi:MAG: DNA internalization-related competence protein ComEC/Rec2 [Polyangiaceae bacterium]|nr:DNA internalization-related competence protein ComEC/Rec2 [Polyangiaceae bacterium]